MVKYAARDKRVMMAVSGNSSRFLGRNRIKREVALEGELADAGSFQLIRR
jgi:hypothetical protein